MMNQPDSLDWKPIKEKCGVEAWNASPQFISSINRKTKRKFVEMSKDYSEKILNSYESRRIFEDGIGFLKWAARFSSNKNGLDVIEITHPLLDSKESVKIKAAYEILEWFILGRFDNEL